MKPDKKEFPIDEISVSAFAVAWISFIMTLIGIIWLGVTLSEWFAIAIYPKIMETCAGLCVNICVPASMLVVGIVILRIIKRKRA